MPPAPQAPRGGRVVYFDAYPHVLGGAQRLVSDLAAAVDARGWVPRLVVPAEGPAPERFRDGGFAVDVVPAPPALGHYGHTTRGRRVLTAAGRLPGYWRRLARAFSEADVVHVNDPRGIVLAGPAARLAGVPLVWHLHIVSGSRWLNRVGVRLAASTVVVSDGARASMPGLAGADVEPSPVPAWALASGPVQPGPRPLAVTTARIHPDKGIDVLVKAWAAVVRAIPDARLRILGDVHRGSEAHGAEIDRLINRLDLDGAVERPGWVDAPAEHWHDAWVYVQPTPTAESFGLAAAEAMACGLPAVVTDIPGLRDRVDPGITGLRVAPGDPEALAGAIIRLLGDADLRSRLGQAARTASFASRRMDDYADAWAARYCRLADGRRGQAASKA